LTGAGHRVFVVDDEEMIRESIVEFLDDNGYQAVGASDGRDALQKLGAASDGRPCLILLDLMMPGMDGRAFREHQLQSPELAAIPVIVFSAHRDVATAATEMNAAGHLEKPLRLPELLRKVRQYCANKHEHEHERGRFS
jgi:CheY-like chemotaxis protein